MEGITIEEASAIIKRLERSNESVHLIGGALIPRPSPYAAILPALAHLKDQWDYIGSKGPIALPDEQLGHDTLMEFERQTSDLLHLGGVLDHTRLLFERKVLAERGDHDAVERLEILNKLYRIRCVGPAREGTFPDRLGVDPGSEIASAIGPQIWALLIGNDAYPQSPLRGAVNDSEAWKSYLVEYLGVPENHITRIQNADRKTMISALYDLRDNDEIKDGDHVLFAYSGHGTSYAEEDINNQPGPVEALCPVDRGIPAPDISDREVLLILSEVHNQTKANITVVLDCCHSGGGTREFCGDRRFRGMNPLGKATVIRDMFRYADEHPRRRSTISVRSPAWTSETVDLYRPVLLAACQDFELAREENGHGVFTSAVMQVLRSEMGKGLTCSGLINAITPLRYDQNPIFDGEDGALFQIR